MSKRGTDHTWQLVKYNGDGAIYARCKCKHHYNCGRSKRNEDGSWCQFKYQLYFIHIVLCVEQERNGIQKKLKELINTNLMTFRREKI